MCSVPETSFLKKGLMKFILPNSMWSPLWSCRRTTTGCLWTQDEHDITLALKHKKEKIIMIIIIILWWTLNFKHNGTIIYAIRMFEKLCSLRPMWYQIGKINEQVREIMRGHPDGVHFVCYSQGTCYALCLVDSFNSIKFWNKQIRLTYLIFINKNMHMTTRYMYAYFHFRIEICRKNITQKLNTFTF